MKLQIKNMGDKSKFEIDIDDCQNVKDLKRKIATKYGCKISNIRLIYAMEIMKNIQPLSSFDFKPKKPISLYISESHQKPKETNKEFSISNLDPPISQPSEEVIKQFQQKLGTSEYSTLDNPEVQSGISEILKGIQQMIQKGNRKYDEVYVLLDGLLSGSIKPEKDENPYPQQLKEMEELNIASRESCIEALRVTNGNVDDAVAWIIDNNKVI
ncbi:UV excision repair protein RAD23 B [Histomonas meleagridis]|uniref:UV excision repair protein RAD23-like B n=1 Tax=Histomonas meleagridis TaxID=135588 RepID=UPI003559B5A9|nr:UV excision repair protein RAD23 B [Histomonas meleagridis]KAH0802874.1 UV excision repair protein RAD23-like B [Histomonas meleagridis]